MKHGLDREADDPGHRASYARRFVEAAARYSQVVKMRPDHGEAWRLLGVVALQRGDPAARNLLEHAIRIDSADASAHSALGAVNEIEGKLDCAYAAYVEARAIDSTHEATLVGLTRVALQLGRTAEAIAVGEAALARGTVDPGLLRALGAARLLQRDYRGAADAFEASLSITPRADAYANLAGAYVHLNRADAAIVACERALALDPSHAVATLHLGIARFSQGASAPALAAFERAVELGSEEAHIHLGTLLLELGDYRRGWAHFGWVTATRRANPAFPALPMWDGTTSPEQHLLIWHEQGVGDTIQMIRFIRRARALVGSITLACKQDFDMALLVIASELYDFTACSHGACATMPPPGATYLSDIVDTAVRRIVPAWLPPLRHCTSPIYYSFPVWSKTLTTREAQNRKARRCAAGRTAHRRGSCRRRESRIEDNTAPAAQPAGWRFTLRQIVRNERLYPSRGRQGQDRYEGGGADAAFPVGWMWRSSRCSAR